MTGEPKENNRFSEQLKLSGFAEYNQRRLVGGRVLICGAGTVAQVVALNLINVGLGSIKIVATELAPLNNLATILAPSLSLGDTRLAYELIAESPLGDGNRPEELLRDSPNSG